MRVKERMMDQGKANLLLQRAHAAEGSMVLSRTKILRDEVWMMACRGRCWSGKTCCISIWHDWPRNSVSNFIVLFIMGHFHLIYDNGTAVSALPACLVSMLTGLCIEMQ